MEVVRVIPSGYCKGVVNAINIAKKVKEENPNIPVYVLGMIVHNTYVTEQLTKLGIITLDDSKKTKEEFPFGPSICLAYYLTLMVGQYILTWYLGLF